jgi:CRISPR-associated protein Csd2
VLLTRGEEAGYDIFVKEKAVLNTLIEASHEDERVKKQEKKMKIETARTVMCERFYDIRTFGAVLSTGDKEKNAGQVRGPVQLTFARSVDPIVSLEHSITVCAARKADKPIEEQIGIQGRKFTIPYGLYVARGFVSAPLAAQTGFSDEDLELLWEALVNMFEHDRSAARGMMTTRKLVIFKHASKLGNAPAHTLFDRVKITRRDASKPTRAYEDYDVNIVGTGLPAGVEIIEKP